MKANSTFHAVIFSNMDSAVSSIRSHESGKILQTPVISSGDIVPKAHILHGIAVFASFLHEAEADFLCGALIHQRSKERINYRAGYHERTLRLRCGTVKITIPHLRWVHARVLMAKRIKRMENIVVGVLEDCFRFGVSTARVETLINVCWTVELPQFLLATLTQKITELLEDWRRRGSQGDLVHGNFHSQSQPGACSEPAACSGYAVY